MGNCMSSSDQVEQAQTLVGQGVGDVQQIVTLVGGAYKRFAPHAAEAKNRRDETKALKAFIGVWWTEAFKDDTCMIPVLDVDEFNAHLTKTNGVLEPSGECSAVSPWGRLLHALAIGPAQAVLTWKQASGEQWDMANGSLTMDIRGEVFCHLINLYRFGELPAVDGVVREDQTKGYCRLPFGWLRWAHTEDGHATARFEPDTIRKMNGVKHPLGSLGILNPKDALELYRKALKLGVSHDELKWPNPEITPLAVRMKHLTHNFERLRTGLTSVLITRPWLLSATNIKARATTNGGNDETFLHDAYQVLAQNARRWEYSPVSISRLQADLKTSFFFTHDRFFTDFIIDGPRSRPMQTTNSIHKEEVLKATLESYSQEIPNSWKGQLYTSRELVLEVLMLPRCLELYSSNVRLLDFTPKDDMWNTRVHL